MTPDVGSLRESVEWAVGWLEEAQGRKTVKNMRSAVIIAKANLRAAVAEPVTPEDPCCERERELRDERVRTAHFHVAHDGTVRYPGTCSDCRASAEVRLAAATPESESNG